MIILKLTRILRISFFISLVTASAIFFASCDTQISPLSSNKLDRAKAKDILIRHYKFPFEYYTKFYIVEGLQAMIAEPLVNTLDIQKLKRLNDVNFNRVPFNNKELQFYKQRYHDIQKYVRSERKENLNLQNILSVKATIIEVKLYNRDFGEISGIRFIDKRNAVVKYTINNINPTPFADFIKPEPNGSGEYEHPVGKVEIEDKFALYDDGWRIED